MQQKSGISAAQLLQFDRGLLSQTDVDEIEDLKAIVGGLRRRNQRLKRRLQRHEGWVVPLPCRTLFEVKTFGLDVHQRQELSETLLGFAGGLLEDSHETPMDTKGTERPTRHTRALQDSMPQHNKHSLRARNVRGLQSRSDI